MSETSPDPSREPVPTPAPETSPERGEGDSRPVRSSKKSLRNTIALIVIGWTLIYNFFIKGLGVGGSFFGILDTISDDLVLDTTLTLSIGVAIVAVFSITKLYTQIVSNIYSFRILEDLLHTEFRQRQFKQIVHKLLHFEELPHPDTVCPRRPSSIVLSLALIYAMSLVYVVLFSEALFFLSWSAGVGIDIDKSDPENVLKNLPMLALAIPFSARVMAYARYRYAQDYADFMPGAVFVLLIVSTIGTVFKSNDQEVFLLKVWSNDAFFSIFWRHGIVIAFVPAFFEAAFWLFELSRIPDATDDGAIEVPDSEEA